LSWGDGNGQNFSNYWNLIQMQYLTHVSSNKLVFLIHL
jgi:hypothetical protein